MGPRDEIRARAIGLTRLSKAVSRALRHEPWLFELELDEHGWTSADNLLEALRKEVPEWSDLTLTDLQMMIDSAAKPRHEIQGDRIRASMGTARRAQLPWLRLPLQQNFFMARHLKVSGRSSVVASSR